MLGSVIPFFSRPAPGKSRTQTERAFLPAALEIVETPPSPTIRVTAALIGLCLTAAIVWAYFGQVDIIATAEGKVIARTLTKIVQTSDTGVVREIDVAEGDRVHPGQVLIKLDPTLSKADQGRYADVLLRAKLDQARLRWEMNGGTGDPFAGIAAPPQVIAAARARLQAEQDEQAAKLRKIDQEISEKQSENSEIQAQIAKIDAEVPIIQAREDIRGKALKSGYGNEVDYLQQQQQLVDMQHERVVQQNKHDEVISNLAALSQERQQTQAEFRRNAFGDLEKAERDIAESSAELAKADQRNSLETVTAPVAGVVQDVAVHTLGGVVTPAQQLLRIVPDNAQIEVEAVISNADVGFVEVGQPAEIKVDTFPFTRYGLLHGHVRQIAQDAVEEPATDQPRVGSQTASDTPESVQRSSRLVYTARVALDQTSMNIDGKDVPLIEGMAVTAEIKTGRRTVLDYVLSPFHRYSHDVLRER